MMICPFGALMPLAGSVRSGFALTEEMVVDELEQLA
jgi:hypothetical protein